jgi:hypothetical protein
MPTSGVAREGGSTTRHLGSDAMVVSLGFGAIFVGSCVGYAKQLNGFLPEAMPTSLVC